MTNTNSPQNRRLVVTASSLGTVFEWYDFYIYGILAAQFGKLFFPEGDETLGFLSSLALFGVGFSVRPFGALVFGRLGDLVGRKYTFLVTILVMGLATALVGAVPTYAEIGIKAPIILVILRLLQGLALGGEYGGAATYVAEHAPPGKRGLYTSWIQTTATLGLLLSLAVIVTLMIVLWRRRVEAVSATRLLLRAGLVLGPVLHPWYLGWVLALEMKASEACELLRSLGGRMKGAQRFDLPQLGLSGSVAGDWLLVSDSAESPLLRDMLRLASEPGQPSLADEVAMIGPDDDAAITVALRHDRLATGLSVWSLTDRAGLVQVRVRAVAMNHMDLWVRRGLPHLKLAYPHRLGCDIAGEVVVLYRRRLATPGLAHEPDTPWQHEVEEAFPYEEKIGRAHV